MTKTTKTNTPDAAPTPEPTPEPLTVDEAVRALVTALAVEEEFVKGIEIRPRGILRLYGTDGSARSARFEPLRKVGA